MRAFFVLFCLLPTILWGQCEVYINPGSIQVIDHNPGISFAFEIQNDDIIPYSEGSLYMDWSLSGFASGPIWDFNLNPMPIFPGGSRFVSTPVFDIPLPENVPGNWTPYAGWTGASYISFFKLALESNGECFQWVLNSDGTLWNEPLSDGCDNPDGDNFCNDACHVELVDYNLETEELTIIPYSTYCPNITAPAWFNQYPYDDPYIFGFTLTFTTDAGSININIGGQEIYASDTPLTIDLSNGILSIILEPLLESINNGEFCDLTLTLYNLNNTGQNINDVLPHQVIELVNLCPNEVIDASLDTLLYDVGCNGLEAYWTPEIYITNNGDIPITEYCIKFQVLGQSNDTICFDTGNIIEPGETFIQTWPNVYDWGVLSLHLLDVNGESEQSWNSFGLDVNISDNMYVQTINNAPDCEPEEIPGCTIEQACNYDPEATLNDGSCDFELCQGCMDSEASNYDPEATIDNPSSCVYDILGCTDETAFNYNPFATIDDGSCIPVICGCLIPSALNFDPLANSQCLPVEESCIFPIYGCTDETANNFNPEANSDDESCTYDVLGCTDSSALNFDPLANIDDGNCEYDVFGCTDSFASNYNPLATVDDGSCVLYLAGCTDEEALNYNPQAIIDDGSCVVACLLSIPNAFTPNNDGLNDVWYVEMIDPSCWLDWHAAIYNRWGGLVWESNTPDDVWIGSNYNGNHYVADGIYVYIVKGVGYNPNNTFQKSGYITIFR
jgi:gliding motility-associated-like protein